MKKKYVIVLVGIVILSLLFVLFKAPKFEIKTHEVLFGQAFKPDYKVTRFGKNYTKNTKISTKINTKKLGTYDVTYKVKIGLINFTKKAKVEVIDKTKPEITLLGANPFNYYIGDTFIDPGVTAIDNADGNITKNVKTKNNVDTKKEGIYTIKYSVKDKSNNKTSIEREVKVLAAETGERQGAIYLTFDDGPNEGTTNVILDILKAENVPATFFVTNRGPDELIKREYDEGHTVALHTYTHNYQTCYTSVEGYFDDLNKVSQRVKNIIGEESKIIRFPGGSSNTVSKKYNEGIMTKLTSEVSNLGYHYFDWNISSGDAGGNTTADGVYNTVVNQLKKDRANIVLMHDIKPYTRDALSSIIKYGKENGYSFEKITMRTQEYHQKVNN
ncbi:MAG: polysaccharide deacetylase family protein [Bacilli bacterium]|nr:polysaccharide deacetylase family protein [Bacilli bacterium]